MSVSIDGVALRPTAQLDAGSTNPSLEAATESTEAAPSAFELVLRGIGQHVDTGERIVARAARGYASLDAAELIALQAGIYRYSEAVELAAKLLDRTTSAVRTVLSAGH